MPGIVNGSGVLHVPSFVIGAGGGGGGAGPETMREMTPSTKSTRYSSPDASTPKLTRNCDAFPTSLVCSMMLCALGAPVLGSIPIHIDQSRPLMKSPKKYRP